jgi:hypothetical protein
VRSHLIWLLGSTLLFALSSEAHAASSYVPSVYIDCGCDDIVGGNLCYTVKERVRASVGFKISDTPPNIGIAAHITCVDDAVDPADRGRATAVSVSITTYVNLAGLEYFETSMVMIVGADRVDEMSTSILSAIDKVASNNSGFFAIQEQQQRDARSKAAQK